MTRRSVAIGFRILTAFSPKGDNIEPWENYTLLHVVKSDGLNTVCATLLSSMRGPQIRSRKSVLINFVVIILRWKKDPGRKRGNIQGGNAVVAARYSQISMRPMRIGEGSKDE